MTTRKDRAGATPWPARVVIELIKLIIVLVGGPGAS